MSIISPICGTAPKKKIGATSYKILLGTIKSNKSNKWSVYEFYKSKNASPDWRIVRDKDRLVLSGYSLGEVSLYDYNQNKEKIKKMINEKEK
jgi:hypothetical protein